MSPIEGEYGSLICSGWIGEAPDTGRDAAFLLLSTPDVRARQTMPRAATALGFVDKPGSITSAPARTSITVVDGWVHLHGPDDIDITRPVTEEWTEIAFTDERVVLVMGYEPMDASFDVDAYTNRLMRTGQMTIGLVPVTPQVMNRS